MTGHSRVRSRLLAVAFACASLPPALAHAQVPTGTIGGRVSDTQGGGIPGVTVTVESASLQGTQTSLTAAEGSYLFKYLPPGDYVVTYRIQGFAEARRAQRLSAAEPVTLDVALAPARVQETVTVTSQTAAFANTVEGAANVKQSLLDALPTTRTMLAAINLSPSAHSTGPSNGVSLSGAMSFDSLYMVNGVPVQENLRGQPLSLFIEDAVQETTITTSGVSAAYGRFGGGIVNMLTKSGGNTASGSFRTRFDNDNWRSVSPFGENKTDKLVPTYEATLGGPLVQNQLWYFIAGRSVDSTVSRETGITNVPYERQSIDRRLELKATQSLGRGRRASVNYLTTVVETTNDAWPSSSQILDLASLKNPRNPQTLFGASYAGSVGPRLFIQAQYSARNLAFEKSGALTQDLIAGTPLRDQQTGAWWWSPNFCGLCPAEERNNTNLVVKGTYFLPTAVGAHDLEFGYDTFNDKVLSDNHQSGSDYHVWATASTVIDGIVYPIIEPGFSTFIIHWPLQQNSQGSNLKKHSLFVNDRWTATRNLSLNLGLRYDRNDGRDSSGSLVSDDAALSPRLGLTWDPTGSGRSSVSIGLSRYVSAHNEGVAGSASPAGNPSIIAYFYDGAPINAGAGVLVPSDAALRRVFDWFNSARPDPFFADIPGVATKINSPLKSPHTDEVSLGISQQVGNRASVRVDFVNREAANFYAERRDTTTGLAFDSFGQAYDLALIENTNELSRHYRALNVTGAYRGGALNAGLAYTLSRLWGNVDGETVDNGPIPSDALSYPEYLQRSWYVPEGDLSGDQRHRMRAWATYDLPWGRRIADVSVSALQSFQSGTPYGAVAGAVVSPFVANPGYALPPDVQTYYFTARDAYRTAAAYRTDIAVNVNRSLPGSRSAEIFAQFQLLNLFNKFQIHNLTENEIDTTVITGVDDGNLDIFNPFTETPVEGVHWRKGDDFGQPVARNAYTQPRLFRFSVGFRF